MQMLGKRQKIFFQHKHNYKQPFAKMRQHIFFLFNQLLIEIIDRELNLANQIRSNKYQFKI